MERRAGVLQLLTTRIHDAAIEGDVPTLINLFQIDPFILDRCIIEKSDSFMRSPLHIAVNLGHLEFTKEILCRKPELAEEPDLVKRWSLLHMASAKGYLEIVRTLLAVNPNMCFQQDQDGRNPVHVAVIHSQIHVLDELYKAKPQAAMEQTNGGETVLHLCVKHSQAEALMYLTNVTDDGELLNSKDRNGNTVLHLAVATKQPEMVKFILKNKRMKRNAINTNGSTAMDIINKSKKGENDREIWQYLKRAKVLRAKDVLKPQFESQARLENHRNALMIVASLIATMSFQVGINPPGGTWQDNNDSHTAGLSIMEHTEKGIYDAIVVSTAVGLMSSLTVILLLISGLPCKRLFVSVLSIAMWIAVTATTFTYIIAIEFLSSFKTNNTVWIIAAPICLYGWVCLMFALLFTHVCLFMVKLIKKLVRKILRERYFSRAANRPPA